MIQPNYTLIKLVQECFETRKQILELQKKDAELRKELKDYMGDERLLVAKDYVVLITTTMQPRFDKDQLMHDIGMEEFKKYISRVPVNNMLIRPATPIETEQQEVG